MGDVVLTEGMRVQNDDAFQPISDSKFCYLDPVRRHAFARFLSGLYKGDGLCTLTGQPGIGKTTLLHHLAEQLAALDGVLLLCPTHVLACRTETTLADVVGSCEAELGGGESGAASLKAARRLQQLVETNCSPILLLDEADLLDDEVLEALITLTGLQAAGRRLVSIVLAGHPSIPGRVSVITGNKDVLAGRTIELKPMSEPDVARLINHRLRAAGLPEDTIGPDAIAQIARHSAGVPGAVVRVCRRAMQIAENRSRKSVMADVVAEVIGEEISDVRQESLRPELVASAPKPNSAPESDRRAPQASISAGASLPDAEFRPGSPLTPSDIASASEPSLVDEPHLPIPKATLGHYPLSGRPGGRTMRSYKPKQHPRGRDRRVRLMLTCASVFLIALAVGLAVLFGDHYELADRAHTSEIDGPVANVGASPASDGREYPAPWRRPATPPESVAQGAGPNAYTLDSDSTQQTRLAPLPSPTKDATEGSRGTTPLTEIEAIPEKPIRSVEPIVEPASVNVSPTAAVSVLESANNKVGRVQLTARMQGLEPGHRLTCRSASPKARLAQFTSSLSCAA